MYGYSVRRVVVGIAGGGVGRISHQIRIGVECALIDWYEFMTGNPIIIRALAAGTVGYSILWSVLDGTALVVCLCPKVYGCVFLQLL